jgi:hypothetical protein
MLDEILKQHTFWILFFDFQNIISYSESKCKILYLAFAPCINYFLAYNPKHKELFFIFFYTISTICTKMQK